MKDLSCNIIEDLLPLYHDNVCSEDSRRVVEDHLSSCAKCRDTLNKIESEMKLPSTIDDVSPIRSIAKKWKADKLTSFFGGAFFISFLASATSFIIYTIKGSYVAPDGTLIESFGYIPIGFLFAFFAAVFGVVLAIRRIKKHFGENHKKK